MKKVIFIVAILISLVILFFVIADLVNSQVSYKYEIEDPIVGDYIHKEFASGYLIGKIRWLKVFLYYVGISIILFMYSISSTKK